LVIAIFPRIVAILVFSAAASLALDRIVGMQIVYWAHSYREDDAEINRHFGRLIGDTGRMVVNFDPPSDKVNESKLDHNLRSCDGLVAILPWRSTGPSQYILHEIALSLRARKPLIVFVDERLSSEVVPARILQRRFSPRTLVRQSREHSHALRLLKAYMGDPPPARYQPSSGRRICGVAGLSALDRDTRTIVNRFIAARDYQFLDLDRVHRMEGFFDKYEYLANLAVVVQCVDSRSSRAMYWSGSVSAAAIPTIKITMDADYRFADRFPREFQPRLANHADGQSIEEVLAVEFDLFEQKFLETQSPEAFDRYYEAQKQAGMFDGHYDRETRVVFIQKIEGDQVMGNKTGDEHIAGDKNVVSNSQAGAVGSHARASDMTFSGTWNRLEKSMDIGKLAEQLGQLRAAMEREATSADQKFAVGAVAAAEESAKQNQGSKTLEYLRAGGQWALGIAEKIGVGLVVAVIKDTIRHP
jgi:hypothetical protein